MLVVNLNPCIDWQYRVPQFKYGGMNRVRLTRRDVAGKGINVCVALKNLGLDPLCMGFNFTENGDALTSKLDELGIRHDFVNVPGAVRVNIKLYEDAGGEMTELNQPGGFVPEYARDELVDKIINANEYAEILVLSGSRPEGVEARFYTRLCKAWRGKVFLDTEGEALRLAVKEAPPFALKPNLYELSTGFGITGEMLNPREIAGFCRENILQAGVSLICVSMGSKGAVLVTPDDSYYCPALDIVAKGVQGAGDAMVAGLVYYTYKNEGEPLSAAMAAAAASVIRDGTEMCSREDFEKMLGKMPKIFTVTTAQGAVPQRSGGLGAEPLFRRRQLK